MADSAIDHQLLVFDLAPVGLLVAQHRQIRSYNQSFCDIFGYPPETLLGQSLAVLYPSASEFEDTGSRALALMRETANYADDRIMRKQDGTLFWCHVAGRTADRTDPFALSVWVFEDMSAERPVTTPLTARERQIARSLVSGKSSKQIAADLGISFRTVEAHRGRLFTKFDVSSTAELIARLVGRV